MRFARQIGGSVGVALCAIALTPAFIHVGPCSRYDEELGFTMTSPENPYGLIACCAFEYQPSDDFLPMAWLFGFLVAAFALLFRLTKSRSLTNIAVVSLGGVLAAGIVGFTASGLGLLLLFRDPGLYVAALLVTGFGGLMALLDQQVSASS